MQALSAGWTGSCQLDEGNTRGLCSASRCIMDRDYLYLLMWFERSAE